ncbi:MAG TPA: DUF4388 domain-containing protein [Acidimicrobiia bacterium]|nr:DUF4388 domain-containing protein [Acidimicrobiia bacterium]
MEGQNLSGQIADWSINDLLQIMQVTKKTGSLDIEGERRGRVHFVDGAVTGAELSGDRGAYQGSDRGSIADILYVLSTLETGTFGVGAADGPDGDGFAVEDVMGEVTALRSLEGEVIDAGLFEAPGVRLAREIDDELVIEPADWQALVALVQPFTFDHLESRVGRGGAVRIFHTLHRLGVAEAIDDEDESEWLDKLADGLAAASSEPTWLEQIEEDANEGPDFATEEETAAKHVAPVEAPAIEAASEAASEAEDFADPEPLPDPEPMRAPQHIEVRGVAAHASTTLTDGVYDEIRRLRSKVSDGK